MSKYIIGDIHGCFKTFFALLDRIQKHGGKLEDIVLVGDLVDRGPESMLVVEYVRTHKIDCVRGNHEQMMIDWHENKEYHPGVWLSNGGQQTLDSYGENNKVLLLEHIEFLKTLPHYLEFPELKNKDGRSLFVAHAGLQDTDDEKIETALARDIPNNDIMWHRWEMGDFPGVYQVIGHTPVRSPEVKTHYANVDTGCVLNRGGYTKLTALKFPELTIIQQDNIE